MLSESQESENEGERETGIAKETEQDFDPTLVTDQTIAMFYWSSLKAVKFRSNLNMLRHKLLSFVMYDKQIKSIMPL